MPSTPRHRLRRALYVYRPLLVVTLKIYALYGVWTLMEVFAVRNAPTPTVEYLITSLLGLPVIVWIVVAVSRAALASAYRQARADANG
jgi:uncharacterized integral membrane protein